VKPYGITSHKHKIYICDTGIGGLEILDLEKKSFEYFVPVGMGQLQFPLNCAVDKEGFLYVADGNRRQVVVFNEQGKFVNAITLRDQKKPTDVQVQGSKIMISALDDHSIHVYNKVDFEFETSFPSQESKDEHHLYQPANITLGDSLVYISDIGACRVMTYSPEGTYRFSFGGPGKDFGQFTRPKGIATDREGNIYVVDAAFENVQIFNSGGQLLMNFGGIYKGKGGMWLPADIAIDYENIEFFIPFVESGFRLMHLIYVTNQYGPDKVSVYGFIEAK